MLIDVLEDFGVPSADVDNYNGVDLYRRSDGTIGIGIGHDGTHISLASARALAAALARMADAAEAQLHGKS